MAKVPASIRYRNPGAMWGGNAISKKWGETGNVSLNDGLGQGNRIAVFPDFVHGICAQIDLWRTPRYANKPFAKAIAVWSGGNWVESYIKFVLDRVPGMQRDTVISDAFLASPMGINFLKAQAWHEAGQRYPAPAADWITAQQMVLKGKRTVTMKKSAGSVVGGGSATGVALQNGFSLTPSLLVGLAVAAVIFGIWYWKRHKSAPPTENVSHGDSLPVLAGDMEVKS